MTLRTRLALGLAAIALLLITPLVVSLRALHRLRASTVELRDREFAASLLLGRLRETLDDLRGAEAALLFVHDVPSRDKMSNQVALLARMADSLDYYDLDSTAHNVRRAVDEVSTYAPLEYRAALAGRGATADSISSTEMLPAIGRVNSALYAAEALLRERTRSRVVQGAELLGSAEQTAAVALILSLLLAAIVAIWLTRSISRPVRALERGMGAVADGDLAYRLPLDPTRGDEFGRLAASFGSMTEQLRELDKLKAEFISIASHELKTPINVIVGYLQLLDEGVYGPLTAKQREVCRTLGTQVDALARLVKQLLDVSRFEAGGGKLEPRPMPLAGFLGDLERAFQILAHQRGVHFEVHLDDGLPEEVVWDQDRMNEVLGNLLSNAFKFTARGGAVTLGVEPHEGGVVLEVRDTGAGIPPEHVPHVFEKFYQANNQGAASQKGTGLGLAIAKQIVEAHGGTITCESTPGVGTTFTITMPARAAGGRRHSAPRELVGGAA